MPLVAPCSLHLFFFVVVVGTQFFLITRSLTNTVTNIDPVNTAYATVPRVKPIGINRRARESTARGFMLSVDLSLAELRQALLVPLGFFSNLCGFS